MTQLSPSFRTLATPLSVSSNNSLAESRPSNDGLAKPPVEAAERLGNGSRAEHLGSDAATLGRGVPMGVPHASR